MYINIKRFNAKTFKCDKLNTCMPVLRNDKWILLYYTYGSPVSFSLRSEDKVISQILQAMQHNTFLV